jgi:hypothetical protein
MAGFFIVETEPNRVHELDPLFGDSVDRFLQTHVPDAPTSLQSLTTFQPP